MGVDLLNHWLINCPGYCGIANEEATLSGESLWHPVLIAKAITAPLLTRWDIKHGSGVTRPKLK